MSDAIIADIEAAKAKDAVEPKPVGSFDYNGTTFDIAHRPNALLLAELSRTGSGDPEALGIIAEFFEETLGRETYRAFKKAVYADAATHEDGGQTALMEALHRVLEASMGRPTQ